MVLKLESRGVQLGGLGCVCGCDMLSRVGGYLARRRVYGTFGLFIIFSGFLWRWRRHQQLIRGVLGSICDPQD